MDYQTTTCEKFGFTKNITEFRINPEVGRPDEAMKDAVDDMIKAAFKTTEEKMKRKVRMFGVAITGAGLAFPVWLPYRAYPQNNADVIMEEINKLGQSGDGDENKKMLLLSEPITMKITCVTMPNGEGPRNVHKFDFGFKEHQRIGIANSDKLCFFYALASSMNYLIMDRFAFNRFMNNIVRQSDAAIELLRNCGIDGNEISYGVEQLPTVQNYWDEIYPGKYRVVAFEKSADPRKSIRVLWKAPMGREKVVPIFLENGHWDGLKNYGHQTCNLWKRCVICDKTYQLNPKKGHECGETYCQLCSVSHDPKRGCYIMPIEEKEDKEVYRIVVWDSETSQDTIYKGDQKEHIINYISVRVTCTECCDDKNRTNCKICGEERTKDWSEAEGSDPTKDFVEWILTAFTNYDTYIFAHNAGRFDGHFVFNYLCRTGKNPLPLINGLKIYEFKVQNSKKHSMLIWRDSCLLMPVKLESLKATFNLECEDKPFFPYYYNQGPKGPCESAGAAFNTGASRGNRGFSRA
ncbi:hypothetical protein niasHT_013829 [Heterodera trifolii]|uniref:DNA-directed DNA polymerase n=1 Tax=Heterodera trifolii TaxID=157864 RepID=A0ABD2KTW7_9BILA